MVKFGQLAFVSTLTLIAAPAAADVQNKLPPDRPPSLMTTAEIRTYNQGLDAAHPYYIRCRKDPVVGSLVRKLRVCRTNYEWTRFAEQGNDTGREILGDVSSAPISGVPAIEACPKNHC
jgi:hypothetical protein